MEWPKEIDEFRSRRWGSSFPGLRTRDPPLSPPSTWAEIFWHTFLQSHLQNFRKQPKKNNKNLGKNKFYPAPPLAPWGRFLGFLKLALQTRVDGGPSGGSSMRRPGNEDPHRRERNSCRLKSIRFLTNEISGIARIFQKIQNFLSGNRKGACPFLYPQRLSHSNYFWTLLYTTSTDRLCTHTCGAHTVLG